MPVASIELFPERPTGKSRGLNATKSFGPSKPEFVSVTCTKSDYTQTVSLCKQIIEINHTPTAHLLCAGNQKKEIDAMVDATIEAQIPNVLALRGDKTVDNVTDDAICDTVSLVELLVERNYFNEVMVAGYPDVHPDAKNSSADFLYLTEKIAAGATRVITQFSFEVDTLCAFRDRIRAKGIDVAISAGLLPIRNYEKMMTFANRCKATVPADLQEKFTTAKTDDHKKMAQEILTDLTVKLYNEGFDIHFYTLNSIDMINEAWASASQ